MPPVSLDDAKSRLAELIGAALRGETVSIALDDEQSVQLVPVVRRRRAGKFGSARGQIWMADDFDAPLDEFKEWLG